MFRYDDLLMAKFKYKGSSVEEGFDCWNLCREVYRRIGKELPSFEYLVEDIAKDGFNYKNVNEIMMDKSKHFKKIEHPEPFCLVSFWIRPPYTTHVGVVLDDCQRFIHILEKGNVMVERLDSLTWKHRITGFWKYDY